MTAFVMVVMAGSFAWLVLEGWRWWRAGPSLAAPEVPPFAAQLATRALEQRIDQLQVVVTTQQEQIAALRAELDALKAGSSKGAVASGCDEVVSEQGVSPAAASRAPVTEVSPEYAEPLALARRGADPEELARRCGVTLAEAQLIWALAQSGGRAEAAA
ncbi:hypothetical protein JCM16106_11910 [Hydrogenophilus islandicus]